MKRREVIVGAVGVTALAGCVEFREETEPDEAEQTSQDDEAAGAGDGDSYEQQDDGPGGDDTPDDGHPDNPPQDPDTLAGTPLDEIDELHVPVAIEHGPEARDITDITLDALSFWEDNAKTYAGFDIRYTRVTEDAYLTIDLAQTVTTCGIHSGDINGCADLPEEELPAALQATVETSLTDRAVFWTAVHELGHTLGLTHDDAPQYYMDERRPEPWERDRTDVSFGFDAPTGDILAGLRWLAENTDSVRGEFQESETPAAGILVDVAPDACEDPFAACTEWGETYSDQVIIRLDQDLDAAVRDWHVAHLVATLAGEVPGVLDADTPYEVRSSDWWDS